MKKLNFGNQILDNLRSDDDTTAKNIELPGTIGKLTEREKFHAAKQILLGIALLYVFTVLAYLTNTVAGVKLLDIITVSFPPLATLILASYFKNN